MEKRHGKPHELHYRESEATAYRRGWLKRDPHGGGRRRQRVLLRRAALKGSVVQRGAADGGTDVGAGRVGLYYGAYCLYHRSAPTLLMSKVGKYVWF